MNDCRVTIDLNEYEREGERLEAEGAATNALAASMLERLTASEHTAQLIQKYIKHENDPHSIDDLKMTVADFLEAFYNEAL